MDSNAALWLPVNAFGYELLTEIPPGSIARTAPHYRNGRPSFGIRFDFQNREYIFALTPFYDGRIQPGQVVDISQFDTYGYRLTLPFSFEADFSAAAANYKQYDDVGGELVTGEEGFGIIVKFSQVSSGIPINLATGTRMTSQKLDTVFGTWRICIDTGGISRVVLGPFEFGAHRIGRTAS